jgi:probable HAF family extracellular repeat protein
MHNRLQSPWRALFALAALSGSAFAQPTFTGLGDLEGGQIYSEAWGVSADGSTVVGASITSGHIIFGGTYGAFRWTQATGLQDIYNLGGIGTVCKAYAANANGSVIVGGADYGTLSPTQSVAFIWMEETGAIEIGDLPGGPSGSARAAARGISANAAIVAGPGESDSGAEAFRFTTANSMFLGLGDLEGGAFSSSGFGISADGSAVVGSSTTDNGILAFRWSEGDGMESLGHLGVPEGITPFSEAYGANADGSVVVGLSRSMASSNSGWEAFRWTAGGEMVGLGDLPGGAVLSAAYATTADGSIVVGSAGVQGGCTPFGCQTAPRAFIWDAANGLRDLNVVLTGLGVNLTGWTLSEARGISANGRVIVGTGSNPQGNLEAWRVDLGGPACPADINGDLQVDLSDLTILLSNYGTTSGATLEDGDVEGNDGDVDLNDLTVLLANFGATCG